MSRTHNSIAVLLQGTEWTRLPVLQVSMLSDKDCLGKLVSLLLHHFWSPADGSQQSVPGDETHSPDLLSQQVSRQHKV